MNKKGPIKKKSIPFSKKKFTPQQEAITYPIRLNKFIAKCGSESRRSAAELVKKGAIRVNGNTVLEPYYLVNEGDKVEHGNTVLKPEKRLLYFLLNKPKNVISTTSDEKGRTNVIDLIQFEGNERIYPVGRLDRDTTGLILLTNDGDLAAKLAHPSYEVQKKYEVSLRKPLNDATIQAIEKGVDLEDGKAVVDQLRFPKPENRKRVELTIHMGRNRIIRRLFEHLGYEIVHLDRTYYAGLSQKGIPRGQYRSLSNQEVIMLRHFI